MDTPRIVFSMTTIPSRINLIEPVIKSALEVNTRISALYLNLPNVSLKGDSYTIPVNFLSSLNSRDRRKVIINRCGEDLGPITKIIPTLYKERDPTSLIISIDDDVIYLHDIIPIILDNHRKYPDACLSFSGHCTGSFPCYWQFAIGNKQPVSVDWIQGVHTITYPRRLVNPDAMLAWKPFMKKHDDHRLNSYLAVNGIERISMGYRASDYLRNIVDIAQTDRISGNTDFIIQNAKIIHYFRKEGLYHKSSRNLYASSVTGIILIVALWMFIIIWASGILNNKFGSKIGYLPIDILLMLLFAIVISIFLYYTISSNMLV